MASGAGTSALAMFRSARSRRRRRAGVASVLMVVAVVGGFLRWPDRAVLVVAAAAVPVLVSAFVGRSGRDIGRWARGAEGERRTADLLAHLPSRRWTVWHDLRVPGSRANIDHVVVGRTGVWVVDTKSTRAEVRTGWRSVRFGDRKLDTRSTRWEADLVADRLEAALAGRFGRSIAVQPIVAVHGAGFRRRVARVRGVSVGGVRVVPAARLPDRITSGRRRLSRSEIAAVGRVMDATFAGGDRL
jgi:hypothetical protein